jgi:WD40 repeat protein
MKVIPKHRRLVVASRKFKVFEYKKPFNQDTSDDNPILCAIFSDVRFEFYIAGERSVNVWNAKTGKPTRCFRNIFDKDITCMSLDMEHRKLIVGSHSGEIKIFDLLSGVNISSLEGHG